MIARAIAIATSTALLAAAAACSGASETGLFAATSIDGTEPAPPGGGTTDDDGGASSGGTSGGGASSGGASSSSGSGSSSSSSGGASSGAPADGGVDGGKPAVDAGPPWKSPGVTCGVTGSGAKAYCTGNKLCCVTLDENVEWEFACVSASSASACQDGRKMRCDDRTDCPQGQVCCATFEQGFGYRSSQCQASCASTPPPGTSFVRFCDPKAPVDECVALGKACKASQSLDGYSYCQ